MTCHHEHSEGCVYLNSPQILRSAPGTPWVPLGRDILLQPLTKAISYEPAAEGSRFTARSWWLIAQYWPPL